MSSTQTIQNGRAYLENRRTIILVVSPGNPYYFKVDNLQKLFQFANENSDKVLIFLPDKISEHNYRAIGSKKPEKSARANANNLRNKCKKNMKGTKLHDSSWIEFIDWTNEVETSEEYEKAFISVEKLYQTNDKFRTDIRESTETALRSLKNSRERGAGSKITERDDGEIVFDLEEGVKYILKELAFFAALPSIKEDCEQFVSVYHRSWPVLQKFFDGDYDGIQRSYLGFVVFQ